MLAVAVVFALAMLALGSNHHASPAEHDPRKRHERVMAWWAGSVG